jgi:hypothetical protein
VDEILSRWLDGSLPKHEWPKKGDLVTVRRASTGFEGLFLVADLREDGDTVTLDLLADPEN